jgi:hypothetical protein
LHVTGPAIVLFSPYNAKKKSPIKNKKNCSTTVGVEPTTF